MIFVDKVDLFLFYEDQKPKQIYLTANLLNGQLKDLINSDKIIYDNILYLDKVFNTLYENKPKDMLENIMKKYYELPPTEQSKEYKKIFTDFGTIKHWINDREIPEDY
jgi:hypothetical protein